ncbi:ribonuclease P [Streptococcus rubneri]|mgnify:FL=1|uniref:ribonuclease P n=1 Tax=Streptococcus rubneri TaxID=1234680 RepID=UPI00189D3321|nr:ribonuclease P [Streptococcus rubneri]
MYDKIREFLNYQGIKYVAPTKVGEDAERMLAYRALGQEARKEFTQLVTDFHQLYPQLRQDRTSQWMNQAQLLRPHFWAYLQGEGSMADPMFALRLYGDSKDFGVSLEVSFIERKKDEESLQKQNRVLTLPVSSPVYYLAQVEGVSQRFQGTEANRLRLLKGVETGQVRKVLVKVDVNLSQATSRDAILEELKKGMASLLPYYEATRQRIEGDAR